MKNKQSITQLFVTVTTCVLVVTSCMRSSGDEVVKTSFYHPYGPQLEENEWKSQGQSGEVIEMLKSGVQVRKVYSNGQFHGECSWTFPYSKIVERTEEYENGKKFLLSKNYENGSPKYQEQWLGGDHRIVHAWYEDGVPRLIEEYAGDLVVEGQYYTSEGEIESSVVGSSGLRTERSKIGLLLSREYVQKGVVSERETFYPNGQVSEIISLREGKREGKGRRFAESGEPIVIENWKDGRLDGMQLVFEGGQPARQVPYSVGRKEGVELHFRPGTEEIVEEIAWHEDSRHGLCKTYLVDQTIEEWYWKGGRVTEEQYKIRDRASLVSVHTGL